MYRRQRNICNKLKKSNKQTYYETRLNKPNKTDNNLTQNDNDSNNDNDHIDNNDYKYSDRQMWKT